MEMKMILLVISGILFLASNALAAPTYFTGPDFGAALGQVSFSYLYDDLELTLEAGVFPTGEATLWWDDQDGIGVQYSYEQDEIEASEYLRLSFAEPLRLEAVYIADLFNEWGYLERGYYQTNGIGPWVEFTALPGQVIGSSNGERSILINEMVNYITFTAPGWLQNGENHEYALQGIATGTPVPLPSTILLLSSGVLSLTAIRRKLKT